MKETDLYKPVKELLLADGYNIKAEVSDVDIAAIKGDELLIVELKTSLNMKLVLQAVKRQRMTDNVYIAIPRPVYKKRFNKDIRDREYLLRRLSLGLIYVSMEAENPYATVKFSPAPFNMKISRGKTTKKSEKLIKEHNGRSDDYNTGGSVRTKLVTAYRENSLKIAFILKEKDSMKTKELRDAGCPEKTAEILYKNYYGWFEKIGRAEYRLTKSGEKAIIKYRQVIKNIVKDSENEKN